MTKNYYILSNIFFIFLLFPYTTFGLPSYSDSQPYSVLYGFFLIIILLFSDKFKRFPKYIWGLWFFAILCILNDTIFLIFYNNKLIDYFSYIFKYLSFAIIVPLVLLLLKKFDERLLKVTILLWWLISNLQFILRKPLIDFLLPRTSYNFARSWVIGFAPEPGYLSKVCIFFILLIDYFFLNDQINKKEAFLYKLLCFWMIIISYSLTGYLLLFIYLFVSLFNYIFNFKGLSLKKVILSLGLISSIIIAVPFFITRIINLTFILQGRIGFFLETTLKSKSLVNVIIEDSSFKARFSHIQRSLSTFFCGHFFGNGDFSQNTGSLFSPLYDSGFYGALFVSIIVFGFIFTLFKIKDRTTRFYSLKVLIMFFFMTFSESLATNYIAVLLGINLHLCYEAEILN